MDLEKKSLVKRGILFLFVGIFILILFLHFFIGIPEILQSLERADPIYYSLAFVAVVLNMVFASLAWQKLLRLLSIEASFQKTFLFSWIGVFVDILIPAESVSGEISRIYLMSKSSGENAGKIIASVVTHRIISMAVTLSGLLIASFTLILEFKLPSFVLNFIIIVIAGTAFSLGFILYLCFRKETTEKFVNWILRKVEALTHGRWGISEIRFKAQDGLDAFYDGVKILGKYKKELIYPVLFSVIAWILDLLLVFLVFAALGHSFVIPLSTIIIVYSISCTVQTIPIGVPGEVGFLEIVVTTLYTLLGIPPPLSASATILTRVITLWFRFILGGLIAQWIGIKATGILQNIIPSASK